MNEDRPLVSFDWAAKQLLRNKANFEVVEGFVSELLGRDVKITNVLESEGNKTDPEDRYDRVDVVVEDEFQEILLIEIQFATDSNYFQRMLYGVSKAITDRMRSGDEYSNIKKIYSINIVYFDLGQGKDYVYHCKAFFKGLHEQDILELSEDQRMEFKKAEPGDLYPEYYVLKVNNFDGTVRNKLDEWIYFLKNTRIEESFSAKGLRKACETLDYTQLSKEEKIDYDRIAEARTRHRSQINNAVLRGEIKGEAKAKAEAAKIIEKKDKEIAELKRLLNM
jgi:predicted transposase/invertase (TIGR01784 family)